MSGSQDQTSGRVHVRRVGRRRVASGGVTLSDEPATWSMQIRFIGAGCGLAVLLLLLVVRRVLVSFGTAGVLALAGGGVAAFAGGAWALARRRAGGRAEPVDVEERLLPAEVEARLADGRLAPLDLVHERGVWCALVDSAQFSEAAAPMQARAERRRRARLGVGVAIGVVLFVAATAALVNFGEIVMWLARE